MSISPVNLNKTNYNLQRNSAPKQNLGFKSEINQQLDPPSFYKKNRDIIWGCAGMVVSHAAAETLLLKYSNKISGLARLAVTFPSMLGGYIAGKVLSDKTLK